MLTTALDFVRALISDPRLVVMLLVLPPVSRISSTWPSRFDSHSNVVISALAKKVISPALPMKVSQASR